MSKVGLQAGDIGDLISLVYDFTTGLTKEYRTQYRVPYDPPEYSGGGRLLYLPPKTSPQKPHVWNAMSVLRLGQYELMRVRTRPRDPQLDIQISVAPFRFYARVFTIESRYDYDRAEFWKQLHRRAQAVLAQHENISGYYTKMWHVVPEPLVRPSF